MAQLQGCSELTNRKQINNLKKLVANAAGFSFGKIYLDGIIGCTITFLLLVYITIPGLDLEGFFTFFINV